MNRLKQVEWPYIEDCHTYGIPMKTDPSRTIHPIRFWQEAYLAVLRTGMSPRDAKAMADHALLDFKALTNKPSVTYGDEDA